MAIAIVVLGLAVLVGAGLVGTMAIDLVPTDRGLTYLLSATVLFGTGVITLALGFATLHLTRVLRQPVQMLSADENEIGQEVEQEVRQEAAQDARQDGQVTARAPERTSMGRVAPPAIADEEAPVAARAEVGASPAAAWSKRLFPGIGSLRRPAVAEGPGVPDIADGLEVAEVGPGKGEFDGAGQGLGAGQSLNVGKGAIDPPRDLSPNDHASKELASKDAAARTDSEGSGKEPVNSARWRSFDLRGPVPAAPESDLARTAPQQGDLWAAPAASTPSEHTQLPGLADAADVVPPEPMEPAPMPAAERADASPSVAPEPATMPQRRFAALTAFRTRARAVLDPEKATDDPGAATPMLAPAAGESDTSASEPVPAKADPQTAHITSVATEDALAAVSSALELDLEPVPLRPPVGVEIVGAYESGGVRYTMYANGVVTAEGAGGMDVFESLDALRKHLDATAGRLT